MFGFPTLSPHARGIFILVLVTVLWGTTFPLVKQISHDIAPAVLVALRFSIGILIFLPFLKGNRTLWRDGLILGLLTFASYYAQAIGLTLISSNRSAFITGLNVVMVPLGLALLLRQKVLPKIWGAVVLALLGIFLISAESGGGFSSGDLWTLGCATFYAAYIVTLERVSHHNSLALTAVQMLVVTVCAWLSSIPDLLHGVQSGIHLSSENIPKVLYLAIFATAGTTLLMAFGQRLVSASEAAIIYALEPVFAAFFAYIWIGETLGVRGWLGGAAIVVAMVISQLPSGNKLLEEIKSYQNNEVSK
jgi:drug/metabolite transporter (DMT)-like permease